MQTFTFILKLFVGLVVLLVWAIVGLLVYVPLLIRQVSFYSIVLSAASLGKGKIDRAQAMLENAIEFYPRGFSLALRVITNGGSSETGESAGPSLSWGRWILEVIWTIGSYLALAWLLGYRDLFDPIIEWFGLERTEEY